MTQAPYQNAAPEAGQESVSCTRCSGTGVYRSYGACWRCAGTGLVAPAKIQAFFIERPGQPTTPPAPVLEDGFLLAKAAAKARKAELLAEGFAAAQGRGFRSQQRVELVAWRRDRPGECFHVSYSPRGEEENWVPLQANVFWKKLLKP